MVQFTNPPPAPNRGDRATFSGRVDAFLRWLVAFVAQLNVFVANLNARDAGGASTFSYTFDSGTADSDPGDGYLRLSETTQNAATYIYVDNASDAGMSVASFITTFQVGTSNIKGSIRLEKAKSPGNWVLFDIFSVEDKGGYKKISVIARASSSTSPFASGDSLLAYFTRAGDKGDGGGTPTAQQIRDAVGILPISSGGTGANTAQVGLRNLGGTSLTEVFDNLSQSSTISSIQGKLTDLDTQKASVSILAGRNGANTIGTSIGNSAENELTRLRTTIVQKTKGSSKEEKRSLSTGVNWVSTMRATDPASKSGTAGFTNPGTFVGDNTDNFAAWELPFVAQSYVCQARIYWSGSNNNCLIGYNSSATSGAVDVSTFYSVGFASTGFVFNDRVTLSVLYPAANLTVGYYTATFMYNNGFFLISLTAEGSTKAQTFIVNKTLGNPRNAQIGCYSNTDMIRDFRFCATQATNPFAPPFGGQRAMSTPLSIPNTNPSGVQISVHLPAGYDPRVTHRLAVYCHGSGGTDKDLWTYPNENSVLTSLLEAGYVVMSANYGQTAWGNPESVTQNIRAIQYVIERYNVFRNPYVIGQSMGGMVSFNTILVGGLRPAAYAGIYPAFNLRYQYDNGFGAAIEGAYGFSGSQNFDTATNGFDVINDNQSLSFRGINMKLWHSYGDTVVPRAPNSDAMKTLAEAGGGIVTIVTSQGDHGDPSSFDGTGIVNFFGDY